MSETPQFLYVVKPTRPDMLTGGLTDAEQKTIGRHLAYLRNLTTRGVAILVGRTQTTGPETMGLVIFEAQDEKAARETMNNDPAIVEGVMTGTLYPYKIALMRDA